MPAPPLLPRLLLLFAVAPLAVTCGLLLGPDPRDIATAHPLIERERDFVGSRACAACHPDHHASWSRTFHSTMTQLPSRASVLGRFDGEPVAFFGARATPRSDGERFLMDLPRTAERGARTAEVALLVGSRRYQQYFETEGDTYRRLPLLWHVGEQRWLHMNAAFLEPEDENWERHTSTWNGNCVFCHNTGPAPGFDRATEEFDTHVEELGIACEACHGPGAAHAERQRDPRTRYLGGDDTTIVDPLDLPQAESVAVCGQCHSQRLPRPRERLDEYLSGGPPFRPGARLDVELVEQDTPPVLDEFPHVFRDRFWDDGTARLTAYEYLGTTQSPCFAGGELTCHSCHTMHDGDVHGQITEALRGDQACLQCHVEYADDPRAHTHHDPAGSGGRCLDCHMPRIVYGVLDLHRSHRIEVPAPRAALGRPDGCTLCHADQSAAWAQAVMRDWWGTQAPAEADDGLPQALRGLHAGDVVQRAVSVRALGEVASAAPDAARTALAQHLVVALGDGYPSIRILARRALRALDTELALGLSARLEQFDPLAPAAERLAAMNAMFGALAATSRARGAPPDPALLLSPSHELDLPRVQALLDQQSTRVISIGE